MDDAVRAHAKGPVLRGRMVDHLHTLKVERRKRRDVVNASRDRQRIYIALGGPEMSMDSPMLGSVYSHIKEPLRNTPSKYRAINKREKRHRGICVGGGEKENIRGNSPEEYSEMLGWRILREKGQLYMLKVHYAQAMFGFQQRTNMETNKGTDWLGAIRSVTTKPCGKHMAIR